MSYPVTMRRRWIPGNLEGIRTTLESMARLARAGAGELIVRDVAAQVMEGSRCPGRELRDWLAERWVVVPDPWNVELVSSPLLQLERWIRDPARGLRGDCDDVATLGAALSLARRIPARYCAIITGAGPVPDHVYTDVLEPPGFWIDLDIMRPADGATHHSEQVTLYL